MQPMPGAVRGAPAAGFSSYGAADPSLVPRRVDGRPAAAFSKPGMSRPWLLTNRQKILLFVTPCIISAVLYILFANVYHRAHGVVLSLVVIPVVFLAAAGILGRGPPFNLWLVLFCLFGILTTTSVSAFAYQEVLGEYWRLYDSNTYSNILPSEPASGYADGGKLLFADGTRVDGTKSLGFKDRDMYCVAPIVDDSGPAVIEYWAVGKNCCGARGVFDCDDAWDTKARSGVRVYSDSAEYMQAVKMAGAFYGMGTVEKPLFVRWVVHPDQVEMNYWRWGAGIMLGGLLLQQLLFLAVSLGVNVAMKSSLLLR